MGRGDERGVPGQRGECAEAVRCLLGTTNNSFGYSKGSLSGWEGWEMRAEGLEGCLSYEKEGQIFKK